LALLFAGCAAAAHRPGAAARAASSLPSAPPPTTATTTTTTLDPGWLPQTDVLPSSAAAQFQAEMAALWEGVVSDSPAIAMAAFFPESAYLQVKTIPDPAADFENRLVAEYDLDIGAAHDLLGAEPAAATLVGVLVPTQYAHWVPPGTCSNAVGYYEVANSRVVYRLGGAERSFGIASLISWRGVWYVVHLGAIVRSGTAGEVDDPSSGPGTSAPSTSC
jgi:hypothetical protein